MKASYQTLLLDLDNTLLDFDAAEVFSFFHTCKQYHIAADEALLSEYHALNDDLWRALEKGEITKNKLVVERFAALFSHHQIPCDPAAFNRDYLDNLALKPVLVDGALEVCRELSTHCRLVAASNGVSRAQNRRLAATPLLPYFSGVVVSDAAGVEKPETAFFDYAMAQCQNPERSTVLMVGDSLTADIAGGMNAGIDTCWFNPKGLPHPKTICPTLQIASLRELPGLILRGAPICSKA